MTAHYDANMFCGQFPFRGAACATLPQCAHKLRSLGLRGAIVSPFEAVFQKDAFAAERNLSQQIRDPSVFHHFQVVNPTFPWWPRWAQDGLDTLQVQGIRLVSLYHGYRLDGPEADDVFAFAARVDLPVLVMCRMQDSRMAHLLHTTEAGRPELEALVARGARQRIILAGVTFSEMMILAASINGAGKLLLDTSRLKGPWRTFEKLAGKLDMARLAFGSLWPINLPECPLEQIRRSPLPPEVKEGILGGNLRRLLRMR